MAQKITPEKRLQDNVRSFNWHRRKQGKPEVSVEQYLELKKK